MKRKVVSYKSLPAHIPLLSTAVIYLFLDKFHAPEWLWASVGTLWAIFFITCTVVVFAQESVDLFLKSEEKNDDGGIRFDEKCGHR